MTQPNDPAAAPLPTAGNWNIANVLTFFRIALVPVFAFLMLTHGGHETGWRLAAAFAFAVAVYTDRLDGDLARSRNLVTDVGKIADPIADKALVGTALIALNILDELPVWVTVVILFRELGITLLRLAVVRRVVLPAGRGGKLKVVVQMLALFLYVLPLPDWAHLIAGGIMAVAVVLTVVTGVDYLLQILRLLRREPSERPAA